MSGAMAVLGAGAVFFIISIVVVSADVVVLAVAALGVVHNFAGAAAAPADLARRRTASCLVVSTA